MVELLTIVFFKKQRTDNIMKHTTFFFFYTAQFGNSVFCKMTDKETLP